jgi:hypothetical protein
VERYISPKPHGLTAGADGEGLYQEAFPDLEKAQPALTREEILLLAPMASSLTGGCLIDSSEKLKGVRRGHFDTEGIPSQGFKLRGI